MKDFREALSERVLLFDGAMGTEIYKRGVFINRSYDEVNLTAPEIVQQIHEAYVAAGADIITTNTFGANQIRLLPFGLEESPRRNQRLRRKAGQRSRKGQGLGRGFYWTDRDATEPHRQGQPWRSVFCFQATSQHSQ